MLLLQWNLIPYNPNVAPTAKREPSAAQLTDLVIIVPILLWLREKRHKVGLVGNKK